MGIKRIQPPLVAQHLKDSCWAACLQAWSRAEHRLGPWLDEMLLVQQYGETPTGGITPAVTYPKFRERWKVWADAYRGDELWRLIQDELPSSHIMCAYHRGGTSWHAVLIYELGDDDFIHFMDPDGGRYGKKKMAFFSKAPIARVSLKAA